jgi:hypothetical protein
MDKKFLVTMIIALLAINVFMSVNFHKHKKQSKIYAGSLLQNPDELHTLRVNFAAEIGNSDIRLKDITAKDSLNNMIPLQDFFRNGRSKILVCRFSDLHCETCIDYSIRMLLQWVDSIGKDKILFLGAYRNNKIFNRQKPLYGIDALETVNTIALHIPAEDLGYPYYFVLDSTLRISNVFIPDKGVPNVTNKYLELVKEKYFNE